MTVDSDVVGFCGVVIGCAVTDSPCRTLSGVIVSDSVTAELFD